MPPIQVPYDRLAAVAYAHRWAYRRATDYYDYERLGGDCTNFASQCIYAGSGVMDFTPTFGWYYRDANDKAPAWTGVEYFYRYLIRTGGSTGPFAAEISLEEIQPGDLIQLDMGLGRFSHTPVVVAVGKRPTSRNTLVAAHSADTDYRPLVTYPAQRIRCLHILGVRKQLDH
ncbi:amidase domain-containing protein [Pseudoflavonifractor sp. MSJ-37]|uniref:amidase domain-containing protein n=1 Tax=Pseudoflavonifractor sp. MSJ-37 TaxID=2841531 RepID=UPI001C0FE7E3|nr:amidase domain-containing protein [Pseudoflavonifractor sp. MSJ-37]MBU5434765.1 amidase domain-containing protein [Pseudoflavonifractor sp. MSJ-37]